MNRALETLTRQYNDARMMLGYVSAHGAAQGNAGAQPLALGGCGSAATPSLAPLAAFGLLETRTLPGPESERWMEITEYRVTQLYDRFLRFNLGGNRRTPTFPHV